MTLEINKPLQGMAPTQMPSNIWHAGMLTCSSLLKLLESIIEEYHGHTNYHTDGRMHNILTPLAPVGAKNIKVSLHVLN